VALLPFSWLVQKAPAACSGRSCWQPLSSPSAPASIENPSVSLSSSSSISVSGSSRAGDDVASLGSLGLATRGLRALSAGRGNSITGRFCMLIKSRAVAGQMCSYAMRMFPNATFFRFGVGGYPDIGFAARSLIHTSAQCRYARVSGQRLHKEWAFTHLLALRSTVTFQSATGRSISSRAW